MFCRLNEINNLYFLKLLLNQKNLNQNKFVQFLLKIERFFSLHVILYLIS